ncbi:MAG: TnpV protein [Clostridia bacterium]|nr:TnpV protein [Clostridia bacterium]
MKKKAKITYRQVGDYLIPNLKLPPEETKVTLGKWGILYKDHLQKHKSPLFNSLLIKGKLYQHCAEVENQANKMYDLLVEQMKEREGVTEQLKEENQMEWVRRMNVIQQCAKEIVCTEIIYT